MDHNSGYEKKDIPVRPVLIGGVIFILTVLGTIYMLYEYYIRVLDSTTYEFKLSKRSTNLDFSFYFSFTNKSCACPNSKKRISKRTANRCY